MEKTYFKQEKYRKLFFGKYFGIPKKFILLLIVIGAGLVIYQGVRMTVFAPKIVADVTGQYLFQTINTSFQVKFGLQEETPNIVFQRNGIEIIIELPSKNMTWQQNGNSIQAFPADDYSYKYSILRDWKGKALGLKTEIIFKEPPHLSNFVFPVENLESQKIKDVWYFFDTLGREQFYMPAPFMEDAKGERSEEIKLEVYTIGKFIKITPSRDWLDDAKRVYPVKIDSRIIIPEKPKSRQELIVKK